MTIKQQETELNFISHSSPDPSEIYILKKGNGFEVANLQKQKSYKWTSKAKMGLSGSLGPLCVIYPDEYRSNFKIASVYNNKIIGVLHRKQTLLKEKFYGSFKTIDGLVIDIYIKIEDRTTYIFNKNPKDGGILLGKCEKRYNGKHGLFNNRKYFVLHVAGNVDAEFLTSLWLTTRDCLEKQKNAAPSGKVIR